jgi:hypothetical protein
LLESLHRDRVANPPVGRVAAGDGALEGPVVPGGGIHDLGSLQERDILQVSEDLRPEGVGGGRQLGFRRLGAHRGPDLLTFPELAEPGGRDVELLALDPGGHLAPGLQLSGGEEAGGPPPGAGQLTRFVPLVLTKKKAHPQEILLEGLPEFRSQGLGTELVLESVQKTFKFAL